MPYVLHYAARSDVGRVRAKNDDSAYVGRHLAVLADGMGGHVGGDVASASAVLDLAHLDDVGYEDPATVLPDEIQNANLVLNELVHANPKLAGMGTTCTAALLAGTTLHMAHIGDSRAYRVRGGQMSQVTRDHTFVQRLVDEGRLDPAEAQHHPNKNVLMRVLGDVDASPELDVFAVAVEPGERWLLCSDGLTDVLSTARIEEILTGAESLDAAAEALVERTLAGGAPDNVTVVVFEIAEATAEELTPAQHVHLSEEALAAAHPAERGPVSGRLLREDLDARPHVLVGAADSAVRTDRIPVVTRSSTRRRAAVLLGESPVPENRPRRTAGAPVAAALADEAVQPSSAAGSPAEGEGAAGADGGQADVVVSQERAGAEGQGTPAAADTASSAGGPGAEADTAGSPRPEVLPVRPVEYRRGWFFPVFTALLALLLGAVVLWGYLWTQTQYYVGEDAGTVAVYKGVPQRLGPLELSHVDRRTDVSVDALPPYAQERVRDGMAARDLDHAEQIVAELEGSLAPDHSPASPEAPTPSSTPTPTRAPAPSGSPAPTEGSARP
ncbi:PP2C family serine/threonine-protein phosphatase [Micrococcus sp.]|uniref:PP2C family protein-serine/threonine phosphatase n=1 Tax=Micrococcus sp. TaxID=1271 RepID=UPI002A90AB0A|nr:PP2C family serine/threonine-protein phosphatase [Micrococcus sp.]MDY6055974.1 PP2C family serine/threonine-protein phosphatase [Micrococcus sp.]